MALKKVKQLGNISLLALAYCDPRQVRHIFIRRLNVRVESQRLTMAELVLLAATTESFHQRGTEDVRVADKNV